MENEINSMNHYSTINWQEKDPNEVYDLLYDQLEEAEQYPFFAWLMEHFPDLEIDWLETFEDLREGLFRANKIDAVVSFVAWYKRKNLDDYCERFEFIELDLCNYFLYKNDAANLRERVAFIQQHPIPAIDTLAERLLYQLIYHGHYEAAVSYAESVWEPVNESEELIGFAAYPFINTIYLSELQKCYEAGLSGRNFDEEGLYRQMLNMGFEDDKRVFNQVLKALKEDVSLADIRESIQKGKDSHMLDLNIHFLKHMLHAYQLPFVFSDWIWNFIATTKIFGRHKGVENWFYLDAKTLDKHIADKFNRFFSSNELEIFGKVWGLDFVFEFLYQQQLVSDEQYEKMLENHTHFRHEMIRIAGSDLWQMMFVFRWPRPNNFLVDSTEQMVFDETYRKNDAEAIENVKRYLADYPVPDRIKGELELNKPKKEILFPSFSETTPYIKQEPDIGRNDPCPCGSGKKYKKCCLNN